MPNVMCCRCSQCFGDGYAEEKDASSANEHLIIPKYRTCGCVQNVFRLFQLWLPPPATLLVFLSVHASVAVNYLSYPMFMLVRAQRRACCVCTRSSNRFRLFAVEQQKWAGGKCVTLCGFRSFGSRNPNIHLRMGYGSSSIMCTHTIEIKDSVHLSVFACVVCRNMIRFCEWLVGSSHGGPLTRNDASLKWVVE